MPAFNPLQTWAGGDVAELYFETSGGKLRLRKRVVPAMFTVAPEIVRQVRVDHARLQEN
jgi:hypothetical protein